MEVGSQRLSDLLNAEDTLSVSRVRDDPTNADWQAIDREDMMIVVAPPHAKLTTAPRASTQAGDASELRPLLDHRDGTSHTRQSLGPANAPNTPALPSDHRRFGSTAASPEEPFEDETLLLNIVNVSEDLSLSVIE